MLNENLAGEWGLSESQNVFKIIFLPRFLMMSAKYLKSKSRFFDVSSA